ncbi:amidohydrolase family-domain-containing protein [Panaeolus papilionaceus]|nr:amidohydrolase family-domain-containing protein [Panaeolus papilionaceus]
MEKDKTAQNIELERMQTRATWRRTYLRLFLLGYIVYKLSKPWTQSTASSYIVCSSEGRIYTVDDAQPTAECIGVRDGRVLGVGQLDEVSDLYNPFNVISSALQLQTDNLALQAINFVEHSAVGPWIKRVASPKVHQIREGSSIVPGLTDAHAHIVENGYMLQLPLMGCQSVQEVVDRIKAYILSHPDVQNDKSKWIGGMGWDQTKWESKQFPTAADLDRDPLLQGRLIALSRVDGHARWVSPAVLEHMGELPEEVDGGLIVRDSDGKPTGVFVDNAMELINMPPWSEERVQEFFELTIKQALSYGLTSIHDADTKLDHIHFFKKMAEQGKLPNRVYMLGNIASDEYWGDQLPRMINHGKHGRLNLRGIKLYSDGALGSWGAALLEPYSDDPSTSGLLLSNPETIEKLVRQFWKDGWQTAIHCIGDRANREVLNIYEKLLKENATITGSDISDITDAKRPRIEHAQIFEKTDLERIGRLGVIASVQPTHATSDMWYAETRLGPERIKGAYAYQTLLKASSKGVLPLGSDFPIEGVNPLLGFYASTARLSPDGTSPHGPKGWYMNEALTRAQALKGMTLDAAYASFAENEIGSLVKGKKADFVILDRDIMDEAQTPLSKILDTKVLATVVDGTVAYGEL